MPKIEISVDLVQHTHQNREGSGLFRSTSRPFVPLLPRYNSYGINAYMRSGVLLADTGI